MKKNPRSQSGSFIPRIVVAFALCSAGVLLAAISFAPQLMGPTVPAAGTKASSVSQPPRYMPVPGGEPDDLDRMETEWNNRLTYPTGLFDPAWVRQAAAQDALLMRSVPAGLPANNL